MSSCLIYLRVVFYCAIFLWFTVSKVFKNSNVSGFAQLLNTSRSDNLMSLL